MGRYIIRDREAGNEIDCFDTLEEAIATLNAYEEEDMEEGMYEEDFYEIYDSQEEEICY